MKFNIHSKTIDVTDSIKRYIEDKIGRLQKYFKEKETEATVVIKEDGINKKVEVTIPVSKLFLRAEEKNKDLYAAIDLVTEKLERQIRKNKSKAKKSKKAEIDFFAEFEVADEDDSAIIKRKRILSKPMSEEEAIIQMELIDHDFFVFKNEKTNSYCVLYKRKNGNYGLIDTE